MTDAPWTPGLATAIGSMPGSDVGETARIVVGELPDLVPFPELPARGVGADILGRTAGLLVDLAVQVVPSGYRVAGRPGGDHRRAVDLRRWDLDAVEQAVAEAGVAPAMIKLQVAGPWTLTAGIELERGHRVLTDHGALRDFAASLTEGVLDQVRQVRSRTGAEVMVQLDEPTLPAVLAGSLPTPSGYGTVAAVAVPEAQRLLGEVIDPIASATGHPVAVHCCAPRPPVAMLRKAGAGVIALDATRLGSVSGEFADELGEAWDSGTTLWLGLVPSTDPDAPAGFREYAQSAFDLAARLGFSRAHLARRGVPTPTCGLAGASPQWARTAIGTSKDIARLFADEAESASG